MTAPTPFLAAAESVQGYPIDLPKRRALLALLAAVDRVAEYGARSPEADAGTMSGNLYDALRGFGGGR